MQLDVDIAVRGGWAVVAVRGELDLATGPQLRQEIASLVADGHRQIAVDLTALDFIDSIGLGLLVAAMKRVRSVDGTMFVAADDDRIRRPFELTGLDVALNLVPSVEVGVGTST